MKKFLRNLLAAFVAILLFILIIVVVVAIATREKSPDIDENSYVVITLEEGLPEYPSSPGFPNIMAEESESLHRVLSNLEKVAADDRILGVIFKFDGYSDYPANIEEIRYALEDCKNAGKKIYGYATLFDRNAYYLASACDSIIVAPGCYFSFLGMKSSGLFIRGTLDKLGIEPELSKIKEYKSAAEMIMEEEWTDAARENRVWLMDEQWNNFIDAVGNDRGLSEDQVLAAMDHAFFDGDNQVAVTMGLVDDIMYWDELKDRLRPSEDDDDEDDEWLVCSHTYSKVCPESLDLGGDKKIAVVHAGGMIGGKESGTDPLLGPTMGYQTVNKNLKEAFKDEDVEAIIFRINSGGGDALTSDLISRQVELISKEKPVVVSMVGVAASGGYMIAYKGNKILANEGTYTGSIGSISGKFVMRGFYEKLGLTQDFVSKGPNALIYSDYQGFSDEEWEKFHENHLNSFHRWMYDVARFREIPEDEIGNLAYGRVWTGGQAKDNGLIDEVGGLKKAIEIAKELADIPMDEQVSLCHYPEIKDPVEQILSGEGNAASFAAYQLYRLIHHDIPNRIKMVQQGRWHYWNERVD